MLEEVTISRTSGSQYPATQWEEHEGLVEGYHRVYTSGRMPGSLTLPVRTTVCHQQAHIDELHSSTPATGLRMVVKTSSSRPRAVARRWAGLSNSRNNTDDFQYVMSFNLLL